MTTQIQKHNAERHLSQIIEGYRKQYIMPAVGAGLVIGGELVASVATGVRKYGTNHETQPDDLFQLGSITKPMTGYLVARLINQNDLQWNWERTIGYLYSEIVEKLEAFLIKEFGKDPLLPGEKAWLEHYRETTITDLMTHTSGLDWKPLKLTSHIVGLLDGVNVSNPKGNLIQKRKLYTEFALRDRPYAGFEAVGGCFLQKYSFGCVIVASMAEKQLGVAWEDLMKKYVFQPLGITHYAFGPMSATTSVTNTWQHLIENSQIKSIVAPSMDDSLAWTVSPAAVVALSVDDFGKWIAAIISNPNNLLSPTVWTEYVNAPPGRGFTRGGWIGGMGRFSHEGGNGWSFAVATIDLNKGLGMFACTNICNDEANAAGRNICAEMEAMGEAWDAFEFLHQAVDFKLIQASADSVLDMSGTYDAQLVSDMSFRTRWAAGIPTAAIPTPTLTAQLDKPRMLKGVIICQAVAPYIQTFEIEISSDGVPTQTLSGPTLDSLTTHSTNGLVIRTLFDAPIEAKTLKIRVKSASKPPTVSRLLVLEYDRTVALDFDIDEYGHLWVIAAGQLPLTTEDTIDEQFVVLGVVIKGGVASLVRKAHKLSFMLGNNNKVWWRDTLDKWTEIADTITSKRIAVNRATDTVWSIDAKNRIRRYDGTKWVEHPGALSAKDICVHNGTPFVVDMDGFIYRGTSTAWQKLPVPGSSPKMKRVAVAESGRPWAITTDNEICSYNAATDTWEAHPGGGKGTAITVYTNIPYIIGMDGTIWKSTGNGWKKLKVLQDKLQGI